MVKYTPSLVAALRKRHAMRLKLLPCLLLVLAFHITQAQNGVGRWEGLVARTWETYKASYIFCGANCGSNMGLVFDPWRGYDAPSEGIGYGLLMAVMMDDQSTFDILYEAAHEFMLDDSGLFHWLTNNRGDISGSGSATDGDQDIAAALIFAQALVQRGVWQQHDSLPYSDRAAELLEAIYDYEIIDGQYIQPGDQFGGEGQEITNLSYFSPAWYRLFNAFENSRRWTAVIDQGYESLLSTAGSERGLAPDWSTADGEPAYDFCDAVGRSRDSCSFDLYYDAIRVPWRIGLDCLWFNESRACDWTQRSVRFLRSQPDSTFARMYDMQGSPIVDYQDVAMVGMWLSAACAASDQEMIARLQNRMLELSPNVETQGYWGYDPNAYYNNSLAWFGAALVSGTFRNLAG
jgi:endo-1,4-beta-D-glucanase Y